MVQLGLSKSGYTQVEVFHQHVKGGLNNPNRTQCLRGVYLLSHIGKPAKVSVSSTIINEINHNPIENSLSIRFAVFEQLRCFIFNLIKSYVYFGRCTNKITPENVNYLLEKDIELLTAMYRENME